MSNSLLSVIMKQQEEGLIKIIEETTLDYKLSRVSELQNWKEVELAFYYLVEINKDKIKDIKMYLINADIDFYYNHIRIKAKGE